MIRNFQCKSCGVQFSADDSNIVECPFCQSDVVEPITEKKPILRILMLALGGIAIIIGVAFLVNCLKQESKPEPQADIDHITIVLDKDNPIQSSTDSVEEQVTLTISVGNVVPDKKTKTYSFEINVDCNVSGEKHYYLAEKGSDNRKEYKLENGMIRNVPPAIQSEGGYVVTVEITDQQGNVMASEQKDILGFVEFKDELRSKLTLNEVQKDIDGFCKSSDSTPFYSDNGYDNNVKFICGHIETNSEDFAMDIFESDSGIKAVKVVELHHNQRNLVDIIYLESIK